MVTGDSGKKHSKKPLKKGDLGPLKVADESHPIFSNPITIGFGSPMGPLTPKPEEGSETAEEDRSETGSSERESDADQSTKKPYKKRPPPPMKFLEADHPIYSNPTVITFVPNRKRSSPDSEIPEPGKPDPASPEDAVGEED